MLDSNIYVSGLQFGGRAVEVLDAAHAGQFSLLSSTRIRQEVEATLLSKFRWDRHSLHLLEIEIWNVAEMIQTSVSVRVCRDPKDDHVLETCLAGGADLLVTGDNDLLVLGHFGGTQIVTPSDFFVKVADRLRENL